MRFLRTLFTNLTKQEPEKINVSTEAQTPGNPAADPLIEEALARFESKSAEHAKKLKESDTANP